MRRASVPLSNVPARGGRRPRRRTGSRGERHALETERQDGIAIDSGDLQTGFENRFKTEAPDTQF